ncbi:MAG: ImmA/IrrE family metallo-endopeptidase [Dehalococcoidia bacterium]|nr:ImmA/IrrE family metallo-endopeptidase [Dehalococcoidia bacterium]
MSESESGESVVIGAQLKKARELLQLLPEEVASELNVARKDVLDWEEEQTQPTLKQLEDLGRLYGREIDYFLRETPPPPSKIEFRGRPAQSLGELSRPARVVLARFDELCRTALEFENLLNKERQVKLPHFGESDYPRTAARTMREQLDVGSKPLPNLRQRLETEGLRIFELPVPEDAFSGFSFWHSKYGPSVLLNASDLVGRKNFTLAHELAHLLYEHTPTLCYIPIKLSEVRGHTEFRANQFAAEFLLPEAGVLEDLRRRDLPQSPSQKELGQIAGKWGVSIQALGYRLENLGRIQSGYTDTLFELQPRFFRRSRTPKWRKRLGERFVETTFEAYERGVISAGKVAGGLGIPIREAMKEIEQRSKSKADAL